MFHTKREHVQVLRREGDPGIPEDTKKFPTLQLVQD